MIDKKEESPTQILRILTYLTLKMALTIDIENDCIDKAKKQNLIKIFFNKITR